MKSRRLSAMPLSPVQSLRMPGDEIGHERRDEIVTVIVSRVAPQRQRDAGRLAALFEQFWPQFLFDKRVAEADIHEDFFDARTVVDQRDGIMLAPGGTIVAKVTAKRLLAPGHLTR